MAWRERSWPRAVLTVASFMAALTVQAAVVGSAGSDPGAPPRRALAFALGLLAGAGPLLVAHGILDGRERRRRLATDRQSEKTAATLHADLAEIGAANRLVALGKIAAVAHELGTPLGVVHSRAQMIAAGEASGDDLQRDIQAILEQTRRMTRMVADVLDQTRAPAASPAPVDLAVLVKQTIGMLAPSARTHRVGFRFVDPGTSVVAWGDSSRLLQILTNLVLNAGEAMPQGGLVTIAIGSRRAAAPHHEEVASDCLFVDVSDQGGGISAGHMPRLFDTFFTTKPGGSGLGLAISYRIASEHGGWISATSQPGIGSCFSLHLPRPPHLVEG